MGAAEVHSCGRSGHSSHPAAKCWERPCPGDGSRNPTCPLGLGAECPGSPDSGPGVTASLAPLGSHLSSECGLGVGNREGVGLRHLTQGGQVPLSLQHHVSIQGPLPRVQTCPFFLREVHSHVPKGQQALKQHWCCPWGHHLRTGWGNSRWGRQKAH